MRCAMLGCGSEARCTLLTKAGHPFVPVCARHLDVLAEPGTWEPNTTMDWSTATVNAAPGALEGWLYAQDLGHPAILYPPGTRR